MNLKEKRMMNIVAAGIAGLVILLIFVTYIAGQVAKSNLLKQFPPPGTMVKSDQHHLHVNCQGRGDVTIVLEAGLNDFSLFWFRIQPELSRITRTCSYDRAGMGWSESAAGTVNIENAVRDLATVVNFLGDSTPVILVGHSYGSLVIRLYAHQYPANVRALVLVDPANEFMAEKIPGYSEMITQAANGFSMLNWLASSGLMALSVNSIPARQLEGEVLGQYRAMLAGGPYFQGAAAETGAMLHNLKTMQSIKQDALQQIPVTIISRAVSGDANEMIDESEIMDEQNWASLQNDLAVRLQARHIQAKTRSHYIQLRQPELVLEVIKSVFAEVLYSKR